MPNLKFSSKQNRKYLIKRSLNPLIFLYAHFGFKHRKYKSMREESHFFQNYIYEEDPDHEPDDYDDEDGKLFLEY